MSRLTAACSAALFVALLVTSTGCTTVAKQAFRELRGAHADVLLNEPVAVEKMQPYGSVEFSPITTTLGPRLCPLELKRAYDQFAREEGLRLREELPGGSPTLTLDSEALFFQGKGLLSQATFLIRVKMRNGGAVVADAVVVTESKSFRAGDADDLAEASVRALGDWLRKRLLPEKKERPSEND